ncbi:unnamed protein product [Didymodactylos carnosus]|uniref:MAM domain-containing protein n=1 Tax=Didymodactylos carnosus TaxID=1234261 RepID=A0A8S2RJE4_9BILA|nr:unnamed protein product [Didymodactylos carnosus]CAF4164317.1 unnamed protein product [Didymodactylos carnosus]
MTDMYFCYRPNATSMEAYCSTSTNETMGICDQGFYGIETFNTTGTTSYELLEVDDDTPGYYCLGFFYYFTNGNSKASISVMIKPLFGELNETIGLATEWTANRWHEYRKTFEITNIASKFYFVFERPVGTGIFNIAIDEIRINPQPCGTLVKELLKKLK